MCIFVYVCVRGVHVRICVYVCMCVCARACAYMRAYVCSERGEVSGGML